jgi:hypothetical protein
MGVAAVFSTALAKIIHCRRDRSLFFLDHDDEGF